VAFTIKINFTAWKLIWPVNLIENTACLVIFEADETPENIRKACGRVINEIVQWGKIG
jgi:hypothetical protein